MSIARQYTTLKDLAHYLGHSSISSLIKLMLAKEMRPVFAFPPETEIYITNHLSVASKKQTLNPLTPKTPAIYFKHSAFFSVDEDKCEKLIHSGSISLEAVDKIYTCDAKEPPKLVSARDIKTEQKISDARQTNFNLLPCIVMPSFVLFHREIASASKHKDVCALEEINATPGLLLRLNDLRIRPEDEHLLLQHHPTHSTAAPAQLPVTAPYISQQFSQLLQVFNDYQSSKKTLNLHLALEKRDPELWCSPTLRDHAILLIKPKTPKNARNVYGHDGVPTKLHQLILMVRDLHEKNQQLDTNDYIRHLTAKPLSFSEGKAKAFAGIVRLTPAARGGRR